MAPRDKYTVFTRWERGYRKGIHKVPKWTRVSKLLVQVYAPSVDSNLAHVTPKSYWFLNHICRASCRCYATSGHSTLSDVRCHYRY